MSWVACVAVGALLGVGLYTFRYAEGLSYLSNDPKACINCHIMREHHDSWMRSSHRMAATCNDCHVPHTFPEKYLVKLENGWNHSRAFTLQNFPEPIRISKKNLAILEENCVHCHQVLMSGVAAHEGISKNGLSCMDCHRTVGHQEF